jgi:hypothetical protein
MATDSMQAAGDAGANASPRSQQPKRAKGKQAKTAAEHTEPTEHGTGNASKEATDGEVQPTQAADVLETRASQKETGNVSATPSAGGIPELPASLACVRDRLMKRDDWQYISRVAKEMRSECNRARMTKEAREEYVWKELDRLYPEEPKVATTDSETTSEISKAQSAALLPDSGRVHGLGDLPPGWPELPANASLAAEIGWVQANRLYVVEELDRGGTRVHLDRAHEPAPSRAAIGWLETSIRSYAKYVEVAAKATGAGQDEQAQERQERMDLDDVRSLLAEMQ